jgi:hypothetical protein
MLQMEGKENNMWAFDYEYKTWRAKTMEAHMVVRHQGFYSLLTLDSQMAVRPALRAGCQPFAPEEDPWYSFLLGWVDA